jgi:SWI/SNF-related matrix-associated actin-dependent regulator of chromatin subfamily A-like protein 1
MKNMKVTYNINEKHFILRCEEKFPKKVFDTLTYIKEINQPKDNKLIIPHTETNTDILKTLSGFNWSDLAFKKLYDIPVVIEEPKIKVLNHDLFAYQEEGVSFLDQNNGRGAICDEMGLGKTVQSLAWCARHTKRTLIVCPASVKYNWEKEINFWLVSNKKVFILNGRKSEEVPDDVDYMIVNYDIVAHRGNDIVDFNPEAIIIDEFHYVKESKTKRTKAVKLICGGRDHIIGLSGTPIKSRPLEFFNMLNLVNPVMFPSWWQYAQKYCDAKHNRFGWEFKGASNIEELNMILEGVMIRRLKKDVLKDLPDKIRSTVPIELSNRAKYDRAKKDFLAYTLQEHGLKKAEKASNAEGVVKKGALRRLAIEGKMKGIIDWLKDFLEDNVDEKIILFTIHKQTIKDLMVHFSDVAVVIEGDTPAKERTKIVEKFQNNKKVKVFIGNMMSAGTGITLTASSTVCFLEIDYIPNEFLQAEDRAHRIGQKDSVNVYYFLGKDSIDEEIMIDILNPKMSVFNRVIDGKSESDTNIFETLMEGRDEKTK